MTPDEFRRLQLVELEAIKEVDRVCRQNDIRYVIFCGTQLGAVRHKGYIPWDDDADIAMLREDYEKFKTVCNQLNPDIAFFQDHSTDPEYRWGYAKIRRTGTSYIRLGQEHMKHKDGISIDIFPLDSAEKDGLINKIRNKRILLKSILIRNHCITTDNRGFIKAIIKKCAKYFNLSKLHNSLEQLMISNKGKKTKYIANYLGAYAEKEIILRKVIGQPKLYDFEGNRFFGVEDYDSYLKSLYGNYMEFPPMDKRTFKHNFFYLDFLHPYREFVNSISSDYELRDDAKSIEKEPLVE